MVMKKFNGINSIIFVLLLNTAVTNTETGNWKQNLKNIRNRASAALYTTRRRVYYWFKGTSADTNAENEQRAILEKIARCNQLLEQKRYRREATLKALPYSYNIFPDREFYEWMDLSRELKSKYSDYQQLEDTNPLYLNATEKETLKQLQGWRLNELEDHFADLNFLNRPQQQKDKDEFDKLKRVLSTS